MNEKAEISKLSIGRVLAKTRNLYMAVHFRRIDMRKKLPTSHGSILSAFKQISKLFGCSW